MFVFVYGSPMALPFTRLLREIITFSRKIRLKTITSILDGERELTLWIEGVLERV